MENSVNDVIIEAAIAIDCIDGWIGEETENFQVIPGTEDDIFVVSQGLLLFSILVLP